ncbi:MAG TPA: lamin tail domain-containing protein [bacterium]|nr:lamin tail domain-containing protein [bacterium]
MKKNVLVFLFFLFLVTGCDKEAVNEESDIVINEIFAQSATADKPDWIELYNKGTKTIDLSGWMIMDEKDRTPYTIKSGTKLAAKKFLVINQDETGAAGFTFGLGSADEVRIYDADEVKMDKIEWKTGDIPDEKSLGRVPDGSETIKVTTSPTPEVKNI